MSSSLVERNVRAVPETAHFYRDDYSSSTLDQVGNVMDVLVAIQMAWYANEGKKLSATLRIGPAALTWCDCRTLFTQVVFQSKFDYISLCQLFASQARDVLNSAQTAVALDGVRLGYAEPFLVRYNMATGDKETIFTSSDGGGSDLPFLAVDSKGVFFWCNSSVWSYSSDTDSCTKIMKYDYSLLDNSNDVLNQSASDIWSADIFGCVGGNMLFHPVRTDINDLFSYDSVDPNLNWDNFDNYLENGYSYYCAINRETGDFKSFFKQDSNT